LDINYLATREWFYFPNHCISLRSICSRPHWSSYIWVCGIWRNRHFNFNICCCAVNGKKETCSLKKPSPVTQANLAFVNSSPSFLKLTPCLHHEFYTASRMFLNLCFDPDKRFTLRTSNKDRHVKTMKWKHSISSIKYSTVDQEENLSAKPVCH
jgi:hypothetical protein